MKAINELEAALAAATPEDHAYFQSVNDGEPVWRVDAERPTGEDEVIAFFESEEEAVLHCMMKNNLPALIECAKALREMEWVLYETSGLDTETRTGQTILKARAAFAKLEEVR